jgi:hypothetical protein
MLRERMSSCDEETERVFVQAMPPEQQFHGLTRYWEKQNENV